MDDRNKITTSKLMIKAEIDIKDDLDERLENAHMMYLDLVSEAGTEIEWFDIIQPYVFKGGIYHDRIQNALLYIILTDYNTASKYYRNMALTNRDSMFQITIIVGQVILEKWTKLKPNVKNQMVWLVKEFTKDRVSGTDTIMLNLLRQCAGGDISESNIWLIDSVLDILNTNKEWLSQYSMVITHALYTFLRCIVDHGDKNLHPLRSREIDFCLMLMREKWDICKMIGRDLVRLLQNVARAPGIAEFWKDLIENPSSIHPEFSGMHELMVMRTSKRYFVSRLTPELETKLQFLTTKVKFGNQRRYQEWLMNKSTESQSLRCDIIRYICAVLHPSNELLCSEILPRWAIIGWLLTTCTSNIHACNAKLSLFYDWLFYNPQNDSIMNIEPCILVMHHSMKPHPAITATLLDFMCRIMSNFYLPLNAEVKKGIYASLLDIQEKKVVSSLSPLFDNPKLDKELCQLLRSNFAPFCGHQEIIREPRNAVSAASHSLRAIEPPSDVQNNIALNPPTLKSILPNVQSAQIEVIGQSSDLNIPRYTNGIDKLTKFNEMQIEETPRVATPLPKLKREKQFQPIPPLKKIPFAVPLKILRSSMRDILMTLKNEEDMEKRCKIMESVIIDFFEDTSSLERTEELSKCICSLVQRDIYNVFPHSLDPDRESIERSILSPLFVLYRILCDTSVDDDDQHNLFILLSEMAKVIKKIGFLFIYYLKISNIGQSSDKMRVYKEYITIQKNCTLQKCLFSDLTLCSKGELQMFAYLLPDIYQQFPKFSNSNEQLIHLICETIDATQQQELIWEILRGHIIMFIKKDKFLHICRNSLTWESIEQLFFWQLVEAHNISFSFIEPLIPELDYQTNAESCIGVQLMLKRENPTLDLLLALFQRKIKSRDLFTVCILNFWSKENGEHLAELVQQLLMRPNSCKGKKKIESRDSVKVFTKDSQIIKDNVQLVLSNLELMRTTCQNISFFEYEAVQQTLIGVQYSCEDSIKSKYADLLALAVDDDLLEPPVRVLRSVPARRANKVATQRSTKRRRLNSPSASEDSSEQDDDDEDEEIHVTGFSKRSKRIHDED